MQLRPVKREDIPTASTRSTSPTGQLVRAFADSDLEIVQVELDSNDPKQLASVRSTMANYIDRQNLHMNVFSRGGGLYIEKITPEQYAAKVAKREARSAQAQVTVPSAATEADPEASAEEAAYANA